MESNSLYFAKTTSTDGDSHSERRAGPETSPPSRARRSEWSIQIVVDKGKNVIKLSDA
jgi:hypothetical protein